MRTGAKIHCRQYINPEVSRSGIARLLNCEGMSKLADVIPKGKLPSAPTGGCSKQVYAFVEPERLADGWARERIVDEIMAGGVPCLVGTCAEVYMEQAFAGTRRRASA